MPDSSEGPTVLRILLGSHLRRLRESRGITARQAASKIRASESKISRIELGRNAIREIDVLDLLTLYGVDLREREQLLNLAEQSNKPGWWHRYNDILPDWFQAYVGMEEAARSIRVYEAQFVPGLLQTEEYAAAVISLGDFPVEQADRLVMLRKERQRRFREDQLKLWIVLDEAALRRPVAGRRAQLEQLAYLREACQSPTLTLQVIPYGAGGHAAPTGFSILRFAERDLPDVVYVENLTSALYLDKQADVDRYLLAMERLSIVAHEPNETPGSSTRSSGSWRAKAPRTTELVRATAGSTVRGNPPPSLPRLRQRQVELTVLGTDQERLPLTAGVDVRRLDAVLRIADGNAAAGQVRHLDAVAGRAGAALEPMQVA